MTMILKNLRNFLITLLLSQSLLASESSLLLLEKAIFVHEHKRDLHAARWIYENALSKKGSHLVADEIHFRLFLLYKELGETWEINGLNHLNQISSNHTGSTSIWYSRASYHTIIIALEKEVKDRKIEMLKAKVALENIKNENSHDPSNTSFKKSSQKYEVAKKVYNHNLESFKKRKNNVHKMTYEIGNKILLGLKINQPAQIRDLANNLLKKNLTRKTLNEYSDQVSNSLNSGYKTKILSREVGIEEVFEIEVSCNNSKTFVLIFSLDIYDRLTSFSIN